MTLGLEFSQWSFLQCNQTVHTTTQSMPMQLVFGRDANMNLMFNANWYLIKKREQQLINKSNVKENNNCIAHNYKVKLLRN